MRKRKILDRYYEWAKAGYIDSKYYRSEALNKQLGCGLCNTSIVEDYPRLFEVVSAVPSEIEGSIHGFWAWNSDETANNSNISDCEFNPLRQNLVLLMAAMAGEL